MFPRESDTVFSNLQRKDKILEYSNYVFSAIFLIEAILKLIAFGNTYFNNSWNKFDFFVVIASLFDLALEILEGVGNTE